MYRGLGLLVKRLSPYPVTVVSRVRIPNRPLPCNERGFVYIMTCTLTKPDLRQYICEESSYVYTCEEDLDKFMEDLDDNGIETVEQFEDAYAGQYDSGADFAEQLCDNCGYLSESNLPTFISNHIDWQAVWDCELRHDYTMSDVGGYFFSCHF